LVADGRPYGKLVLGNTRRDDRVVINSEENRGGLKSRSKGTRRGRLNLRSETN